MFFQPGISWSNLVIQQGACYMIISIARVGRKVRRGNWSGYCLRASVQSTRGCSGWWPWWEMPDQYRRPCSPSHAWMRWEVLKCPAKWNWDCIRRCWLLVAPGNIFLEADIVSQKWNSVRIQSELISCLWMLKVVAHQHSLQGCSWWYRDYDMGLHSLDNCDGKGKRGWHSPWKCSSWMI